MQVTETRSEGLQREFRVTLPATELEARLMPRDPQLATDIEHLHPAPLHQAPLPASRLTTS